MKKVTGSVEKTRQRANVYWFLASLIGNPIDTKTLRRIADIAAVMPVDETGLAEALHAALAGEEEEDHEVLSDRLATEHARLFRGLRKGYGPPPPYESLWREDRIMGDSTLAVAEAYSEAGFDDNGPWGPCDHIAYELRFMASLCNAEAEAEQMGQPKEADWARKRQMRFLDEHLLAWVPVYCGQLANQAEEALYRALARVTENVLTEDAKTLFGGIEGIGGERRLVSKSSPAEGAEA
ncbi:MAG: molecular chaperone TorD family protein [Candidatus Thiodiazotropha sp. (ex Lucinoma borealis)]|nr:molecular chaperone TorD family protein [Candidatus Thiodiazotropha sp. (ex Troendleina suluensis)]MCU7865604.1 molecular chaperone TorD family protein [Candidatus Thiodiazotropha sp. (ex Lucinoma borealis)]